MNDIPKKYVIYVSDVDGKMFCIEIKDGKLICHGDLEPDKAALIFFEKIKDHVEKSMK